MAADRARRRTGVDVLQVVIVAALMTQGGVLQQQLLMVEGNSSSSRPFPALIMIGDSTIDVGTNNGLVTVIKSDFDPYGRDLTVKLPKGRFCNGLLATDYIAEELGLPYQISYVNRAGREDQLLTGVNFASSGSGWLNLTADTYNVISFAKQIGQLKDYKEELISMVGQRKAESIISGALYLISTGANDYILSYFINPLLQEKYTIPEYQQLIRETSVTYLKELYRTGARKVALTSIPPIGCLPASISIYGYKGLGKDGCVESLNNAAENYNLKFTQEVLPAFRAEFPDSNFVYLDTHNYLYDVFSHPDTYGYKESRRACCGTGLVEVAILCNPVSYGTCEDASEYIFFDSFHPTTRVYKGLKDYLVPLLRAGFKF